MEAFGPEDLDTQRQPGDTRVRAIHAWLRGPVGIADYTLEPASSDASFRRYFRVRGRDGSYIVMDAPPERQKLGPFLDIAGRLRGAGLRAPEVLHADLARGFVLLSDLGTRQYLELLDPHNREALYGKALAALLTMQQRVPLAGLPAYDRELLAFELGLFREWFLDQHLGLSLTGGQAEVLGGVSRLLVDSALRQPKVFVHRDYHSRNLMLCPDGETGILDFQDAVVGPVTYDLVSLLRDCYIAWPAAWVRERALAFRDQLSARGLIPGVDGDGFLRWFDLMGLQRHLKAIGIFARLFHRDGKAGYLEDIPRTLDYVLDVAARYPELAGLRGLLIDLNVRDRAPATRKGG